MPTLILFIILLTLTVTVFYLLKKRADHKKITVIKNNPNTIFRQDILNEDHPTLRMTSKELSFPLSEKELQLADSLMQYIIHSRDSVVAKELNLRHSMGLSAPQVNQLKRMFALHFKDKKKNWVSIIAINPEIISHSPNRIYYSKGESCLSVNRKVPGFIHRYAEISVRFFTVTGEEKTMQLSSISAIAFQHELDHLNGVLFYDHIDEIEPFKIQENSEQAR